MNDLTEQPSLFAELENPFAPGTSASSRYEQMRVEAIEFSRKHPNVWRLFCRFTEDRIARGFQHYSVNAIFERIRWETGEAVVDPASEFKLNNNHRAFYARAWMRQHAEHDGFFRTRRQISKDEAPAHGGPLAPGDFE